MAETKAFSFTPDAAYTGLAGLSEDARRLLDQVGIGHSLKAARFHFSLQFIPSDASRFCYDLFRDPAVLDAFRLPDISGAQTLPLAPAGAVRYTDLTVRAARLEALMPAVSARFVAGDAFKGCAPRRLPGVDADLCFEVDEALCDPEDPKHALFGDAWRAELLANLFMLLRAGGALSQPATSAAAYLDATKELYRMVAAPVRLETANSLTLSHLHAYRILDVDSCDLFPPHEDAGLHPGNRCFLVVDGLRRHATLLYNGVHV